MRTPSIFMRTRSNFTAARTVFPVLALIAALGALSCRKQGRVNPNDPLGSNFKPTLTPTRTWSPTPTPYPAADSFEPDGLYTQGAVLAPGVPQSRSLFPVADVDWAVFTFSQMAEVTIETSGVSGDTILSLYDGAGVPASPLTLDDNSGVGLFSRITVLLPAGTYYVKAEENGGDGAIPGYTLSLSVLDQTATPTSTQTPTSTDTPTDTPTATFTPECPKAITGELYPNVNGAAVAGTTAGAGNAVGGSCVGMGGPERIFTLTLPVPMDITIAMCASSYDSLLYLRTSCFDPTSEIACNDDACGTGGNRSRLVFPALPAGRYYVFIDGFSGSGNYAVTITSP